MRFPAAGTKTGTQSVFDTLVSVSKTDCVPVFIRLSYFDHRDEGNMRGWRSIHITDPDHPYMKQWWVPGLQIGYEHSFVHQVADFIKSLDGNGGKGEPAQPDFRAAQETQKVCDAVLKSE